MSVDALIALGIRQKSRVDLKGFAVTAKAENRRSEWKKRFPDGGSLREKNTSDIHPHEAARNPYPLLIEHQGSRESIAAQHDEHAEASKEQARSDA